MNGFMRLFLRSSVRLVNSERATIAARVAQATTGRERFCSRVATTVIRVAAGKGGLEGRNSGPAG
jgi:hypothetical protein